MSADVIVVGAGVAGAATAFHLSRLGAGDVLVVDRDTAGSGMSSRSSAMIRMHYTFRPEVELAVRSDQMFDAWTGLTEGNIFHGDIQPGQLFHMRPVPGWARYATPVRGLYLCGAGAHPGGGVTGAPGYNAAHRVLADLRRGGERRLAS